jgi:hypothetical protein
MSEKFYFIILEKAGRIEILSGPIMDSPGQDDGLQIAKDYLRSFPAGAKVAETVWG